MAQKLAKLPLERFAKMLWLLHHLANQVPIKQVYLEEDFSEVDDCNVS